MKRILKFAAVCALAACLAACGGSSSNTASSTAAESEAASGYTGTQTATAAGMNDGEVKVTITWENGVVTACDVDASTQTDTIGQPAAPKVAQSIVDSNSPEVDGIAGATITSDAIVEAAKACFDAAGVAY